MADSKKKIPIYSNLPESMQQFIKFGIVGFTNTVISYLLYSGSLLLLNWIGVLGSYNYLIAQIFAFIVSVAWSFYWNNRMVFSLEEGKKRSWFAALIKTYISYSFTGLFLNTILLVLWIQFFGISEFIAPIINLIITVPLNFIINKYWAFRQK